MKNESEPLEALMDIRKMMKESSRFLSLSGVSGVLAGVYALAGAALAKGFISEYKDGGASYETLQMRLILIAGVVLALSLSTGFIMSGRRARKNNQRLFDHSSRRLLWSMAVPLFAGGVFCLALLAQGGSHVLLVSPAMLIFYGLALISSSRLTLHDVKYLGYLEVALGLVACFYLGHGLLFWTLGFGLLHVIYGSIMWYKYDRKD
jgi:hypothetical protein